MYSSASQKSECRHFPSPACQSERYRTSLLSGWITVDGQNEYIYSYMRTAIITSVSLEDKAGFMWLCLGGNSLNVMRDERKPYFLIQFKFESTAAEILSVAKEIWKKNDQACASSVWSSRCKVFLLARQALQRFVSPAIFQKLLVRVPKFGHSSQHFAQSVN